MTSTVGTRVVRRSSARRTTAARSALGLVAGALLLTACSSATGTGSTSSPAAADPMATAAPASVAPVRKVPLGTTVTLPTDTVEVSHFLDHAAPDSPRPEASGMHWASFSVNQCATAASSQARWEVLLADGTSATEPTAWPDGLPDAISPDEDPYSAGDCAKGLAYVWMPDGGEATAIVLKPKVAGPARPEVQWLIGRTSAAS